MEQQKTHWLQNPNKNYLGHWDLPNGEDAILTIESAKWEEVKNPTINTSDAKRVVRFKENSGWIKPFICNEINASSILKSTGQKFMEDCSNKRIKIGVGKAKVMGEEVECLRIRPVPQGQLVDKVLSKEQFNIIDKLLDDAGKDKKEFCQAMQIDAINKLPAAKFAKCQTRLKQIIAEKNKQENANS